MTWSNKDDTRNALDKTVGGLEISIHLSEGTAREKIIESGRAVGWCPPLWFELENGEWLNDTGDNGIINVGQGLSFFVNVKKVWIPKTLVAAEQTRQSTNQRIGCYIRYKFYDTSKYTSDKTSDIWIWELRDEIHRYYCSILFLRPVVKNSSPLKSGVVKL